MQDTIYYLWVAGTRYALRPGTDQSGLERDLAAASRDGGRFVTIPTLAPTALRLLISPGLAVGVEAVTREPIVRTSVEAANWIAEYEYDNDFL